MNMDILSSVHFLFPEHEPRETAPVEKRPILIGDFHSTAGPCSGIVQVFDFV